MSQVAPTPVSAPPTAPSTSDPSTFSSRADALIGWFATFVSQVNALATNVYNNAVDCYNNAVSALTSANNASASATAAASAASAAAWVNGGTYALNAAAISQLDFQTYRKITASSVTTTDPKNDPTNWAKLGGDLAIVIVTGTTVTATSGNHYILTSASATAVTAPTAVDGARFKVTPANGRRDNTVDFGAATIQGPNKTATGVITLNGGLPIESDYSSNASKWVML